MNNTLLRSLPAGRQTLVATLVGLLAIGTAAPAHATITGFEFLGLEALGGLSLSDRIGALGGDTEHFINVDDCEAYKNGRIELTFKIDVTGAIGGTIAYGYSLLGDSCLLQIPLEDNSGGCVNLVQEDANFSYGDRYTFSIDLNDITGGDCNTGVNDTADAVIILKDDLGTVTSEVIPFNVNFKAPAAPVIESITPGEERLTVRWSDDENVDEVTYTLYWDEVAFTEDAASSVNSKSDLDGTVSDIESGLINDIQYYVRMRAVDLAGNESPLSNTETGTPQPTADFWENYHASGGTDQGDYCFIATASLGTPMAGQLGTLRTFRDSFLMESEWGRGFVTGYYRYGAWPALIIAERPWLRATVRVLIQPLVWFAQLAVAFGLPGALFFIALGGVAVAWARRRLLEVLVGDIPLEVLR